MKCAHLCIINVFFVVLATAWRCIYPSGTVWFDVVRVTSRLPVRIAAHLLQHCSSLADSSKLQHEMFYDLHLLTVPLDCTQSAALSSYSVHPISSLLNRRSAAPWDDLNWLNRSTAGIHTSASATCARKAAPQRPLLHISISKYMKP